MENTRPLDIKALADSSDPYAHPIVVIEEVTLISDPQDGGKPISPTQLVPGQTAVGFVPTSWEIQALSEQGGGRDCPLLSVRRLPPGTHLVTHQDPDTTVEIDVRADKALVTVTPSKPNGEVYTVENGSLQRRTGPSKVILSKNPDDASAFLIVDEQNGQPISSRAFRISLSPRMDSSGTSYS